MRGLTTRQAEILAYVRESITERGYPPSMREIGERFGIKSTHGVKDHLDALERKGVIVRDGARARGIRVIQGDASKVEADDAATVCACAGATAPRIDQLLAALRFYAEPKNDDDGSAARAALAQWETVNGAR